MQPPATFSFSWNPFSYSLTLLVIFRLASEIGHAVDFTVAQNLQPKKKTSSFALSGNRDVTYAPEMQKEGGKTCLTKKRKEKARNKKGTSGASGLSRKTEKHDGKRARIPVALGIGDLGKEGGKALAKPSPRRVRRVM